MKTVYILNTEYTNGITDISCVSFKKELCEDLEIRIQKTHKLGDYEYKNSYITEDTVEDDALLYIVKDQEMLIL